MSGPVLVNARPTRHTAMRLEAGTQPELGEVLDPNTKSHAALAGWMMGHGFTGFRVIGEVAPFGLALTVGRGERIVAPGDWVVLQGGVFRPVDATAFDLLFEVVNP